MVFRTGFWRFSVLLALSMLHGCGGNGILDDLKPKENVTEEPEQIEEPKPGDVLWEENFDLFTADGGPDIQSDDFRNDVQNPLSHIEFKSSEWKTVATSHVCSNDYIRQKNIGDWVYLFRCREYEGCLGCGINDRGKRGIAQSPMLSAIREVSDIRVSFKVRTVDGFNDQLGFRVMLSGIIRAVTLDGKSLEVRTVHDGLEHAFLFTADQLKGGWHTITADIEKATDGTMLQWCGNSTSTTLTHGFWLDEIKVTRLRDMTRAPKNLRVLFWNIQNGMWSDQPNQFTNFRKFVEKYDPDVCVWCEAQSIYKDHSTDKKAQSEWYFPSHWQGFAKVYGHKYAAIGGYRLYAEDYYPQVITSKYPIKTLLKITETDPSVDTTGFTHNGKPESYMPVAHGAGVFQVDVNGTKVNFVTLHLWPHAYSYYAKFVINNTSYDSANSAGGNRQREAEIKHICGQSIFNQEFSGQANWLMMGDFNTRSRIDKWHYGLKEDSPFLSSHDYILQQTDYKDIIGLTYPGHFFATRTWANDAAGNTPPRYDFMYASPAMMARVHNAMILNEKWTNMVWERSNYYNSSDHRPILVDFEL
ncbi:MAG: hypothetical protein K6E37_04005 [Bacteroidales bacterium]|nr:hypothetical protein [Bacteroidales bacterium]